MSDDGWKNQDYFQELIGLLVELMPDLDSAPLHESVKQDFPDSIMVWLRNELIPQNLFLYEKPTEYEGWMPDLEPLKKLDLGPYEEAFGMIDGLDEATLESAGNDLVYEAPWFSYLNHVLAPHHLRMVSLYGSGEYLNAICIRDLPERIAALQQCLGRADCVVDTCDPMTMDECRKWIAQIVER